MKIVRQNAEILFPESPMKHIEKIGRICYKSEDKICDGSDRRFIRSLFINRHNAMLEHYRFIIEVNPAIYEAIQSVAHPHIGMTHRTYCNRDRFVISLNARALYNMVEDSHAADFCVLPSAIKCVRDELIGHIVKEYGCYELFGLADDYVPLLSTGVAFIQNERIAMSEDEWNIHGWFSAHMVTDRGISHEIVRHREETSFAQESTRYCNYSKGKFGGEITVIDQGFDGAELSIWGEVMACSESMYFELINNGIAPQMARSVLPTCLKTEIVMTAPVYEWEHFFDLRLRDMTGKPHPMIKELANMVYRQYTGGIL